MKLTKILLILLLILVAYGIISPTGLRAAVANNRWSITFAKQAYAQGGVDPQTFSPPPNHQHAGLLLAVQALKLGQVDLAAQYLQPLIPSEAPLILETHSAILFQQERYEEALTLWRYLEKDKDLQYAANELSQKGESDLELLAYQYAWEIRPETYARNVWARKIIKANALRSQGELEAAIKSYLQTIDQFPDLGLAYYELAWAYELDNQTDQAKNTIEQALVIEPEEIDFYLRAASIYENNGLIKDALEAYQNVLRINPNQPEGLAGVERLRTPDE